MTFPLRVYSHAAVFAEIVAKNKSDCEDPATRFLAEAVLDCNIYKTLLVPVERPATTFSDRSYWKPSGFNAVVLPIEVNENELQ